MALHYQISQDLLLAFPTPMLKAQMPGAEQVNPGLRELILQRERDDPGVLRSNVGGWHSRDDLLNWPGREIEALKGWITHGVQRLTETTYGGDARGLRFDLDGDAWANVLRDGGYNKLHNHIGCSWSGVYYVSLGERRADVPGNGQIEFLDPRFGVDAVELPGRPFGGSYVIDPEPGMLVIFPSWLYHYVNPFHGSGERITVAFNIRVRMLGQPQGPGQGPGQAPAPGPR
ncbi:conserved hypothetical protein [Tistlia consotensis]|uniref:2OG-Fe(II) oxygenase n=1 Tax=Tistlia consotensis USBA 355 TaxID=560819 RepID=A0A1Y6CEW4_9PROT|nr:2OG-Fe(II) oxygenase family protein [Tistlia consotensis]SMF60692.1 conserved hypothetical protein [Tistlia consotensis USBA 355]SNR92964.1 conserved hypothetical protein [Tistlia consotensis]